MEKFFKLKENGTNIKTEVIAGFTTFMTIAYILAVNPSILGATGMDKGALFTATYIVFDCNFNNGVACESSFRFGSWNGIKRFLCLHCRYRNGT